LIKKKNTLLKKSKLRQNGWEYTTLIKVGLELNFTFTSSVTNGGCHLKKGSFWHFLISNFEKFQ
jgi:hypothetical protein